MVGHGDSMAGILVLPKDVIHEDFTMTIARALASFGCVGVTGDSKCLAKSETEYTSTITSIMRIKEEKVFIVLTENSLYIVSADIPVKRIVTPPESE